MIVNVCVCVCFLVNPLIPGSTSFQCFIIEFGKAAFARSKQGTKKYG